MNYPEFETSFETRFQKHTDAYPHAVEYHRARLNQTIQYLLSSILERKKQQFTFHLCSIKFFIFCPTGCPTFPKLVDFIFIAFNQTSQ